MKNDWLNEFRKDQIHSQFGEDGIVLKILGMLPEDKKNTWCVEFGAWDGIYLSVTLALRERGYRSVLIEGSPDKFEKLEETCAKEPQSIPVNCFVASDGENSLDSILSKTPIPQDFDLLVIDIDGNDYNVWKGVSRYRPKVVCIECNPTFPDDVVFIQSETESNQGSSLLALARLGKEKGYELVATLGGNAFLVDEQYFSLFGIDDNSPKVLSTCLEAMTSISQTYRGEIITCGPKRLIWTDNSLVNAELERFDTVCRKILTLGPFRRRIFVLLTALRDALLGIRNGSAKK
jgi:hypothetical protein